jgi:CxxC motif-containing protein (DUF1111 family)
MKRFSLLVASLMIIAGSLAGCASNPLPGWMGGWTTLVDGTNMDQWNQIGDANWRVADGSVQADKGMGFLVSKNSYKDFQIRAEFWSDADANSGIFLRCADPKQVTDKNAYEVNIFDKRPDPTYGTGAIVGVAKIANMPKAVGKWNTYEITAKGDELTVVLNGVQTVQARDNRHASGPIALQRYAGVIKFRKVEIRPL